MVAQYLSPRSPDTPSLQDTICGRISTGCQPGSLGPEDDAVEVSWGLGSEHRGPSVALILGEPPSFSRLVFSPIKTPQRVEKKLPSQVSNSETSLVVQWL